MQTSYGFTMAPGQAGLLADLGNKQVESFSAEGAVSFGLGVVAGTNPETQVAPSAADTDTFRGVALCSHTVEQDGYTDKQTVPVLVEGKVWVPVDTTASTAAVAVAADGAVYMVFAGAAAGKFRADNGVVGAGDPTAVLVAGAKFRTSKKSGDIAVVELG